jgi:hypothetical protein
MQAYFFLSPDTQKGPSLGTLFENVVPNEASEFELELGVVLPDLLPNVDGKPEYALPVSNGSNVRDICFSNVMARLRFTKDESPYHALISRIGLPACRAARLTSFPGMHLSSCSERLQP